MRVPVELPLFFDSTFEADLLEFSRVSGLLKECDSLSSERFLGRSILPHIETLSRRFNRLEGDLSPYWKDTSNPGNRLASYFLGFMPPNLMRAASVWSELGRLGLKWPKGLPLRGLEFGAGPASFSTGIALGERLTPTGLPKEGNWALIEGDRATLKIGEAWADHYYRSQGFSWTPKPFHRKIEWGQGSLLPPRAPTFTLFGASFFLNESDVTPDVWADSLLSTWEKHAEDPSLFVLIEPALKAESRRILELRRLLLEQKSIPLQVLTPCLGHQACGALANPEDWCHEIVHWERPPYLKALDRLSGLDHRSLPMTHLVIGIGKRSREEWLTGLGTPNPDEERFRLVSPARRVGPDLEFYLCGSGGKRRARFKRDKELDWERGDVVQSASLRGDPASCRVESISGKI